MPAAADPCTRRLTPLLGAALAWLAGCSTLDARVAARSIADGVYLIEGRNEFATTRNHGDIGNVGFVVGPTGVAVIDTGSSLYAGERLRASIAATTCAPIRFVVLTQALPEFVLGASAFESAGTPLLAQRETAALLQSRCEHCLTTLRAEVGEDALQGTVIATRISPVDASVDALGTGRTLQLIHPAWAATPGDLAAFDPASGVLFAGALVESARIPNLRDGNLDGWILALETLRRLPLKQVVPGHGAVGGVELIDSTLAYLRALDRAVRARYDGGASLSEASSDVTLKDYAGWVGYPELHAANVQRRYRELENKDLNGDAP